MGNDFEEYMSAREVRRLLRNTTKPVFGWVNLYAEDGEYLSLRKSDLLAIITPDSTSRYQVNSLVLDTRIKIL